MCRRTVLVLLSAAIAASVVPTPGRAQAKPPVVVPPPPPPPPLPPAAAAPQAGQTRTSAVIATELLDRLQDTFGKLAGGSSESDLGHELSMLANDSRDVLAQKIVTPAFHARFARVLLVLRLATITDTGHILSPIVDKEFIAFVRDVTGKTYDPAGPPSAQIGLFSDAVATELTRLRMLARQLK